MKIQNKVILLIFGLLLSLIVAYLLFLHVYFNDQVYIKNAYCDNNTHFNFTIVNSRSSEVNLTYRWHLDDPKSNTPRPIWNNGFTNDFYNGNGSIIVPADNGRNIIISIPRDPSYPQMNLIMDVELFNNTNSIYHYRFQKYNGYWSYNSLPPKPSSPFGILGIDIHELPEIS